MKLSPRLHLLVMIAPLALLVAGNALFNYLMDPHGILREHRLETRSYDLASLLAEQDRPPVSAEEIDILLLGTSRTRLGITTENLPHVLNVAINAPRDRVTDNFLTGLLLTSTKPQVYLVEAIGIPELPAQPGDITQESWGRLLFSTTTTKRSVRLLVEWIWWWLNPDAGSAPGDFTLSGPGEDDPELKELVLKYSRDLLPVVPATRSAIEKRLQHFRTLPVSHDALIVFFDPPYSPTSLHEPTIHQALLDRKELWAELVDQNQTLAETNDTHSPRVTVDFVSCATPENFPASIAEEIRAPVNWFDVLHYYPQVGNHVLQKLLDHVARHHDVPATASR